MISTHGFLHRLEAIPGQAVRQLLLGFGHKGGPPVRQACVDLHQYRTCNTLLIKVDGSHFASTGGSHAVVVKSGDWVGGGGGGGNRSQNVA